MSMKSNIKIRKSILSATNMDELTKIVLKMFVNSYYDDDKDLIVDLFVYKSDLLSGRRTKDDKKRNDYEFFWNRNRKKIDKINYLYEHAVTF